MFYQNYDDYMRDIFYFNSLANNPNNMYYMSNQSVLNNLNSYYPSIYRIVYPVIQRIVAGTNYQYINDDLLNNMVNTVLGIVEGDMSNFENTSLNNTNNLNNNSNSNSNSTNDSRRNVQAPNTASQTNISSNNLNNMNNSNFLNQNISTNNSLFRDLIKILVIKELISRQNMRRFPFNNQMTQVPYYQMLSMNSPYMVN